MLSTALPDEPGSGQCTTEIIKTELKACSLAFKVGYFKSRTACRTNVRKAGPSEFFSFCAAVKRNKLFPPLHQPFPFCSRSLVVAIWRPFQEGALRDVQTPQPRCNLEAAPDSGQSCRGAGRVLPHHSLQVSKCLERQNGSALPGKSAFLHQTFWPFDWPCGSPGLPARCLGKLSTSKGCFQGPICPGPLSLPFSLSPCKLTNTHKSLSPLTEQKRVRSTTHGIHTLL